MSRSSIVLCCATFVLSACGAVGFDVEQKLPEQRIQRSALGGLLPALFPSPAKLTVDLKAEQEKRGTGPATQILLKKLQFNITPAGAPSGNFDFLEEAHLYAESSAAGLPKVEIATLKPVPRGVTSVDFTIVPGVNLLPYVNAGAELSATATGTQPNQDITFDGLLIIDVRI
ncbi:MAG: hypothetical protein Q8N23_00260 [Archangium sp.]|nr:hypothetical protein [Archangium sp.]MDP3151065.1 hypothetical protein [Archangium sp.]MDP3571749.1 hypothetical protein [Archangium sp.]